MSNTSPVVGIDLGTTYSVVAYIDDKGQPVILKNSAGKNITPSVIAFTDEGIKFGEEAKKLQEDGSDNVVSFFKRRMGDTSFSLEFDGKEYDAKDLSGLLLGKLKADAELALGEKITEAVITVPAYFDNLQLQATMDAGKAAGLDVLRIVPEPTAAAITYGITKADSDSGKTFMVYDLGGGTFDITLLKVAKGDITVLTTNGNHELGGKDWDQKIVDYVVSKFEDEFNCDPTSDIETMNEILVQVENSKKQLSDIAKSKVTIRFNGHCGSYEITREKFNELTENLLGTTKKLCDDALNEYNKKVPPTQQITWERIDGVLLVGGSTRMPQVTELVKDMCGKEPVTGIMVDEVVAVGAAMLAAQLTAQKNPRLKAALQESRQGGRLLATKITERTTHSLGMIAENADRSAYINAVILSKDEPIPSSDTRLLTYRTSASNTDMECDAYLLQGESENPWQCTILGRYIFSGITHEKTGKAVLEITYNYDDNKIVNVSGRQQSTGKQLTMRVEPIPDDMQWMYDSPKNRPGATVSDHITVIIAVDVSGSMSGSPLSLAKKAAKEFLRKMDLSHCSIGLIGVFDGSCMAGLELAPSQNANEITIAIDRLTSYGSEPLFPLIETTLANVEGRKFAVILSDGQWGGTEQQITEAKRCHNEEIQIASMGFGHINTPFLKAVANWDMIVTSPERFAESFSTIAQVLNTGEK